MGDIGELYKDMNESASLRRHAREDFYTPIIEKLGGKYLTCSTYRLGDYNIYVSKGMVMHKSNKGKRIPLQVFLKNNYNIEVDGKELNEKMKEAVRNGME